MHVLKLGALGLAFGAALLAAAPAQAQQRQYDQAQMQANLDKKMAKPFVANATWITDYDEALAAAKKSGKNIFAYFTRSYAR